MAAERAAAERGGEAAAGVTRAAGKTVVQRVAWAVGAVGRLVGEAEEGPEKGPEEAVPTAGPVTRAAAVQMVAAVMEAVTFLAGSVMVGEVAKAAFVESGTAVTWEVRVMVAVAKAVGA